MLAQIQDTWKIWDGLRWYGQVENTAHSYNMGMEKVIYIATYMFKYMHNTQYNMVHGIANLKYIYMY